MPSFWGHSVEFDRWGRIGLVTEGCYQNEEWSAVVGVCGRVNHTLGKTAASTGIVPMRS